MYNVFKIPDNFLTHEYTDAEKELYEKNISEATSGQLNEAINSLTDKQKKKVDDWYGSSMAVRSRHNEVFGNGNDRIVIPLDRSDEKPISHRDVHNLGATPSKIADHLHRNGYSISNWVKGHAVKRSMEDGSLDDKPISIAKVLKKIKVNDTPVSDLPSGEYNKGKLRPDGTREAPKMMSMLDAYNADPHRMSGKGDHVMVVTRNKYDVAGVSTNQKWDSCMNMVDGHNRRYLPKDIEHGTLGVFLAHKNHDDKDLKPLARISAKRFDSDDGTEIQHVLENRIYGNPHPTFHKAAVEFFDKHYPLGEKDYHLHPDLYADTGRTTISKRNYSNMDIDQSVGHLENLADRHIKLIDHSIENYNYEKDHDGNGGYHGVLSDALEAVRTRMHKMTGGAQFVAAAKHTQEHESDNRDEFPRTEDTQADEHTKSQLIAQTYHDDNGEGEMLEHASSLNRNELLHTTHDLGDSLEHLGEYGKKMYGIAHVASVNHIQNMLKINKDTGPGDDEMLHHLAIHLDDTPDEFSDTVNKHENDVFGGEHPSLLSRNPRTIHKMMDLNEEHGGNVHGITSHDNMNEDEQSDVAYHIGKHADRKLAHAFHEHHQIGEQNYESLVKGLNSNPDGERIQHSLIHRMYFGNTEHGVPTYKNMGRKTGYDSSGNYVSNPSIHHDHDYSNIKDGDLFNAIAEHSRFHTVLHALMGRHDVTDDIKEKAKGQIPFANPPKSVNEGFKMKSKFDLAFEAAIKESYENGVEPISMEPTPNERTGQKGYDAFVTQVARFMGEKPETEIDDEEGEDSEKETGTNYTQKDQYKTQDNALDTAGYIGEAEKAKKKGAVEGKPKPSEIIINPDKEEI